MSDSKSHFLIELLIKEELKPDELEAQRVFLRALTADGRLLLAGIVPAAKGRGMAILEAESLDQAREIYANAPVVMAGKAEITISELKLTAGTAKAI